MNKVLKFGCAPILLMGVLVMGPASEILSKRDAADYSQLKPVTVAPDKVDTAQEGKLVFVCGSLSAAPIHDPHSDLTTPGLRLTRQSEIWQWIQHERDITARNPSTGKTEHVRYDYSYTQGWSGKPIDSSKFVEKNHQNPPATLPEDNNLIPSELKVGAYKVPAELVNGMGGAPQWHAPTLRPAKSGAWDATKGEFYPNMPADGKPALGTIRITYQVTDLPAEASALGQLKGEELVEFTTPHGPKKPELLTGRYTAAEFLKADIASAGMAVWFFRICDLLALIAAGYFFGLRAARLAGFTALILLCFHLLPGLFIR